MAEECYLGVDLGASSGRVMAGLFDGKKISLKELHRFPNGAINLGETLRWDLLGLWSEILHGMKRASETYQDSIRSIGVDTWGVDYVLMSDNEDFVSQPWHYRDERNRGIIEKADKIVSKREIFQESGLQFLEFNTLFQLLATKQTTPEILEQAKTLLMIPDFFNWCLSGKRVVEFTNATTTQFYHPAKSEWSYDLLNRFDIPTHFLPEVVMPGTELGPLRKSVSDQTGLKRISVVAPATHDTGSAVVSVPTTQTGSSNWAYLSSGTWSLMGIEVNQAVVNDLAFELNVTNEGGIDGTFRLLKNIAGLWLIQECKRSFEKNGKNYDYSQLAKMAESAKPFFALINPDDPSFLTPLDMPVAIQEFCRKTGQPVPEEEGQILRCAFESLALKYRQVLNGLEKLSGNKIDVIHIVGGGSQNRLLNQLTSNACGKLVIAGPMEATVLGNVMVQARTAGAISSLADIREVIRNSYDMEEFQPVDQQSWEDAFGRFLQILP
jgi:rhamnulokinase